MVLGKHQNPIDCSNTDEQSIVVVLSISSISYLDNINSFTCQLCQETKTYYEPFHHITVQPNTDIFSYLTKDFHENRNLTCRKCTTQSCQSLHTCYLFTYLHGRPRKNKHSLGIYENIKLGLMEHHGVFFNPVHYVSYIRQNNKWYHCDDKHITETNLLTLSNNVYLVFCAKRSI